MSLLVTLGLVGFLAVGTGLAAAAEEQTVVGLEKGFDLGRIEAIGGAEVSVAKTDKGSVLRVKIHQAAEEAGVKLLPPDGKWDFSRFVSFTIHVSNPGLRRVKIVTKVSNPTIVERFGWVQTETTVAPGDEGEDWITMRRKKPDWIKVELSGMRGYPWGMDRVRTKPEDPRIDPANIVSIAMLVPGCVEGQVFDVRGIAVGGEQFDPPQLTKLLADPEKFFPFIDEFGQYIHRDWPGKTHSPDDLAAARNEEEKDLAENPGPPNWDKYGGWQDGPTLEATGFFRTAKHEGKWWLVDPDGKLFFSAGITCVTDGETTSIVGRQRWFRDLPARDSQFAECYRSGGRRRSASASSQPTIFDFGRANIIRKYGQDWQPKFGAVSHQRLRSWGVNTIANWSSPTIYQRDETPYVVSLGTGRIKPLQGGGSRWAGIPDVFDADFKASLTRSLSRAADTAQDPWCIGYFVDNEMGWGADTMSLAVMTLACPPEQAAKKAFVEDLKAKYADVAKLNEAWGTQHASWEGLLESTEAPDPLKARQDLEAFHARIAQAYFRSVKEAIKEVAPHHLYLGCRFAPQNPPVVAAAAEYCDVVSLNVYYRTSLDDYELPVKADVPVMCTEFHYGALDRGVFHGGLTPVADQAARAAAYKEFLRSALRHPQFVGCHWFQYRDQCTTGRPLDEENYQIGFVDIADTPYPETIQAARQIGAAMYPYRLSGK